MTTTHTRTRAHTWEETHCYVHSCTHFKHGTPVLKIKHCFHSDVVNTLAVIIAGRQQWVSLQCVCVCGACTDIFLIYIFRFFYIHIPAIKAYAAGLSTFIPAILQTEIEIEWKSIIKLIIKKMIISIWKHICTVLSVIITCLIKFWWV